MSAGVRPLTERPAWNALQRHYEEIRSVHLRTLFADDPRRGERYTAEAAGLYLDYSKHRVTDETVRLLVALAEESDLPARIDAMFRGDKINVTEHRAVLHVALRTPRGQSIVNGWRLAAPYDSALAGPDDVGERELRVPTHELARIPTSFAPPGAAPRQLPPGAHAPGAHAIVCQLSFARSGETHSGSGMIRKLESAWT